MDGETCMELITTPQFKEKKLRYVIKYSIYINDILRTVRTSILYIGGIDIFCKYSKNSIQFRERIMFPLNKYFSKFTFGRGAIYDELFFETECCLPLLETDKNFQKFVEKKEEKYAVNPKYLTIDSLSYKTEYYEIREPIIPYLEQKYPEKIKLIKELKKLFQNIKKIGYEEYDDFLEEKAKFLIETTTEDYARSLKK